jgi:DNA/RNA endonuclease G (NUC1)
MKKFFLLSVCLGIGAIWAIANFGTAAQFGSKDELVSTSPNLVISQFQAGGTANPNDEFVEIHNISSSSVDLNGYRVVYRSANGSNDVGPFAVWTTSTILQPGQFYLIASTGYTGATVGDITYDPSTCLCSMSATAGGLAIRNGENNTGTIIDAVGWGTASNIFFEGTRTTAPPNSTSQIRVLNSCQDTDNNSADFTNQNPPTPRNRSTAASGCSGGGTTLFAAFGANPSTVAPGQNTKLTITIVPATTPPSTKISAVANLSAIGGSATQQFFDDGTNGDTTAGDGIYTYLAAVPANQAGGPAVLTATASDAEGRTVPLQLSITVNAPLPNEDPLILGNPSGATADVANENNYLMPKPQYTLSYNRSKATPNWVAWRLDTSWIGSTQRQDDYRPDPALPIGWYQVQDADYSGSGGYDRGHMCPSGDRTNSIPNNSATFLMTNFVPQLSANNQGAWEDFESYCRTIAAQGNELYIFSGPYGNQGTIAGGKIVVPQYTWKVVLILPNGSDDVHRVWKGTRTIGLIVPNFAPLDMQAPWRNFRVTVDQVERLTGYDFFNQVGINTQMQIERRLDNQ